MNYFIAVLLDLLTVIIVAVPIIRGFVKGVRRCAFSLLSLVVSAVVVHDLVDHVSEEAVHAGEYK